MSKVLITKDLAKSFGSNSALRKISLEIESDQIVGLVGPNGAGKTTLFSLICGFLKPSSGSLEVLGHPPLSPQLQGRVALLPQDAPLLRGVSLRKQFEFFARLQGFSSKEAFQEAEKALDSVDLLSKADEFTDALSHGMNKRASLAQAFIGNPEFLLLDEPTAGLDPVTAQKVRQLIVRERANRSVLISSHNLAELQEVCHSVVILKEGALIKYSKVSEVLDRAKTLIVRLESSAKPDLLDSIKEVSGVIFARIDTDCNSRLIITMKGSIDDSEADLVILSILKEHGVSYLEIRRGESLEEKVLEITNVKQN